MGKHRLIPHPDTPADVVRTVAVEVIMTDADDVLLRFIVDGDTDFVLPERSSPERVDALWKSTCFEMFLQPVTGTSYFEFNFSPSTQWAAYAFDSYREGMRDLRLAVEPHVDRQPELDGDENPSGYVLDADVDLSDLPGCALRLGLAAVIEERGGRKSYWALAHPPGQPDFHHPDCFVLELPAADRP